MTDETRDTTPAPQPRKTAVPPLPKTADMDGSSWVKPTDIGLKVSMVLYIAAIATCSMLAVMGDTTDEVILGTVASVIFVALWAVAWLFVKGFLAEFRAEPLTAEERAYVSEHPTAPDAVRLVRSEKIGRLLVGAPPDPMSAFTSAMSEEEIERICAFRDEEVKSTWAWYEKTGDPQVVHVTAEDGSTLTAHALRVDPKSKRWLLLVHGYKGTWTECYVYAHHYAEHGYNILMPEQRAHATSGGKWICMGGREGRDMVVWAKWLVQTYGKNIRIVMHGHSMGASAVCIACGEKDLPPQVRATVEDCGYSDAWNVFVPVMHKGLRLPAHPILDFVSFLASRQEGGCVLTEVDVAGAVSHARTPLLVMHGEADTFVPPYMARRIYDACSTKKRLDYFPGAGHCQACLSDPKRYFSEVFDFLGKLV